MGGGGEEEEEIIYNQALLVIGYYWNDECRKVALGRAPIKNGQ
jgi:hypothetical protein